MYNITRHTKTEKGSEKKRRAKERKYKIYNIKKMEAEVGSEKEGETLLCILLVHIF